MVRGLTCEGDGGADGAVEPGAGCPGAPAVPPTEPPVAAIVAPAIKLAKAPEEGGPGLELVPGALEGLGVAIGTTLVARGVLLLGLLGCRA